jgi:hypothetical protein
VIETATEDCDSFAKPGSLCRAKGAPNECRLDCSRRGDGTRRLCPPEWGCSLDDICRPQTGSFEPKSATEVEVDGLLLAADFDGDERDDIVSLEPPDTLGRTRLRFHYFDDTAALQETRAFSKLLLSPVIHDFSGDGHGDILFSDTRLGLLLGRSDRSAVPETFGSYRLPRSRVRMLAAHDQLIADAPALVVLTTLSGLTGFYVTNGDGALRFVGKLPGPLESLAGAPVSGNLREGPSSPCRETVLAVGGESHFITADFCTFDSRGELAWREQIDSRRIELSPAAPIDSPPQLVDIDADGHLDVLLGGAGRAYVAYGDGASLGAATPYRLRMDESNQPAPEIPTPLAAGDFTGDGAVDFVFADHLLVSIPSPNGGLPNYRPERVNLGGVWTEAKIADLNANGRLDVIAASRSQANLDFFNGTGTEHPTAFSLPSDGPVSELTIGDFDGDLIDDLAFVEASASTERPESLMIAFGNPAGSPTAPKAVARVRGIEQLSVYAEGGVASLLVASREAKDKTGVVTLLEGSGDRTPVAPYAFTGFAADGTLQQSSVLALAAGSFSGLGRRDVIAIAAPDLTKPTWELWLFPAVDSGTSVPRRLHAELDEQLQPLNLRGFSLNVNLASAAADLNGDGRDEALFAMPTTKGQCGVVFATPREDDWVALQTVKVAGPCLRPQLVVVDADQDGAPDVALLTGTPGSFDAELLVLWNQGDGRFSDAAVRTVNEPGEFPLQFTVISATPTRRVGLAYVTESLARLATVSNGTPRSFEPLPPLAALGRGRGIVAADLNGDGAADLALADSGALYVMKAELAPP